MTQTIHAPHPYETLADLLEGLGDISPDRIRMQPPPGTATEEDVLAIRAREGRIFELVDGVLVEKAPGFDESRLACEICCRLGLYLRDHELGAAALAGEIGLAPGLVRTPAVSFVLWKHLPEKPVPIPAMAPDLAIEVLREANTPREMARKLREYFAAGTQLVWYFDLRARTVTVYTPPDQFTVLDESATLDGGILLPGLVIPLREAFDRATRRGPDA